MVTAASGERRASGGGAATPTSGLSRSISTCWRRNAAPEQTRSPPIGRDLDDFSLYLKSAGRSIANANTDDLRAYLGELSRRGLGVATQARRLSAIRQLYRFLYAEGHRGDDPAAVLEGPKRERALPKTLTLAEVDGLLRAAGRSDPAAPLPVRLRAARLALPGRNALRDRLARVRTRRPADVGRAQGCPRHRRARQGQQGTPGAAQRRGQARDGGLSRAA